MSQPTDALVVEVYKMAILHNTTLDNVLKALFVAFKEQLTEEELTAEPPPSIQQMVHTRLKSGGPQGKEV